MKIYLTIILIAAFSNCHASRADLYNEENAKLYLRKLNIETGKLRNLAVLANWEHASNLTEENLKKQLEINAKLENYKKEKWYETIKYPWRTYNDADVKRQFEKFSFLGTAALPEEKGIRFNELVSEMQEIYAKTSLCHFKDRQKCDLTIEPDIYDIFRYSEDPEELKYIWKEWRERTGRQVRKLYKEYVDLSNEAAILNNFTDNAQVWIREYESKNFRELVEELWVQLKPLYLQLHAYVRHHLRQKYGEEIVSKRGPIPAHLLGNMWAQNWINIGPISHPFSGKKFDDITEEMVYQEYTPLKIFKQAEEFFVSIGLNPMPESFWQKSIFEKPKDRDIICHSAAWDFYDGKDFRIKRCTTVEEDQIYSVHHEMGHIEYYIQYKDQPYIYKDGANPGFQEAIGDVIALSVSTPKHLHRIGLIKSLQDDAEVDLNRLYYVGLEKLPLIPFAYLVDLWRWNVFSDNIKPEDYNCEWWRLRETYQGIEPPVDRSEDDFDPGAKYHIVADESYIRYFVSYIIQFQFHRALCEKAEEYVPNDPTKPLHQCDIYENKDAGKLLKDLLKLGASRPWPEAMEVITGQRKMDVSGLLEYFRPLQDWLEKENQKNGEHVGWQPSHKKCSKRDA